MFHLHWPENQQVREVLKKNEKIKLGKRGVISKKLENFREIFITLKKTCTENTNRRNFFLAACSLFLFSTTNDINYDVTLKLRPYDDLIGKDNSSLK